MLDQIQSLSHDRPPPFTTLLTMHITKQTTQSTVSYSLSSSGNLSSLSKSSPYYESHPPTRVTWSNVSVSKSTLFIRSSLRLLNSRYETIPKSSNYTSSPVQGITRRLMALFNFVNGDSRMKQHAIDYLDPSAAGDRGVHRHQESEIYQSTGITTKTYRACPASQDRTLLESRREPRSREGHSNEEDRAEAWTTTPSDFRIYTLTHPI